MKKLKTFKIGIKGMVMFNGSRVALLESKVERLERCCEANSAKIDHHTEHRIKTESEIVSLTKKIDEFLEAFKEHDREEMKKYDAIKKDILLFKRVLWIGMGIGVAVNIVYWGFGFAKMIKGM